MAFSQSTPILNQECLKGLCSVRFSFLSVLMICKKTKSNVKFFAEGTMHFSVIKDPQLSASDLNHDLEVINQWAYQWKIVFNPDPTKQATELRSCKKQEERNHSELTFNGASVARAKEHKHLDLILEPNLSSEKHLYEKMVKAKRNIEIIKQLNRFLLFTTLNKMYKTLVRPHLDYCDIIYHIHHFTSSASRDIQYQAALAVTGAWQGSNRVNLYELGWDLSLNAVCVTVLQIHKIVDGRTPSYLRDKMHPNGRNLANLPCIRVGTDFRQSNFQTVP